MPNFLIFNSNDLEADDLIKELLLLGIQVHYNNPEENDLIGQLAFYLSAGKKLLPFADKKRRMQLLVTSTQIYKGSQSFESRFIPSEVETINKLMSAVSVIISTAAPVEYFELWRISPELFRDKTFVFYGAVNTNEWLLGYIQQHHADLCAAYDNHPLLQKTRANMLKTSSDEVKINKALAKAKAHLVMQDFFKAFGRCYCLENFPLWGVEGQSSSSIVSDSYPLTASHSKALYGRDATELGKSMGLQVRDEASAAAKKQGEKIAGFITYSPNGDELWQAFKTVFQKHEVEFKDEGPKDVLTDFDYFRDNTALMNDLSKAHKAFCDKHQIPRKELTYENDQGKVSVDIYRAFSIWSRTAPYDYQILNADGLVAIVIYELLQKPENQLLMQNLVPQALVDFDGSYPKFTVDAESHFFYPKTLPTKEAIQHLTLYLDILMSQLIYDADKTLYPQAGWRQVYQASGLAGVDPVELSAKFLANDDLRLCLQKAFNKQDLDLATAFRRTLQPASIVSLIQHRAELTPKAAEGGEMNVTLAVNPAQQSL